ncbi:MAG: hypothetical protein AMXMBFR77_27930 [Phycisphaerales bacterium]
MPGIGDVPFILTPTEMLPGQEVVSGTGAPQARVALNSNHAWAKYSPSLVTQGFAPPLAQDTTDQVDHVALRVPESADLRPVELVVWARNLDGSNAATITAELEDDGDADSAEVPADTTVSTQYILTVTAAGPDALLLRGAGSTGLRVDSIALRWATVGSDGFEPKPSGFKFTNHEAELGPDDPLSDEMLNRWLKNPRRIWLDRPGGLANALDGLQNVASPLRTVTGDTRSAIVRASIRVRYRCSVRWWALLTGPATGSACIITDDQQDDGVTLAPAPATDLPASGGPYAWLFGVMTLEPGIHRITAELRSNGVDATTLWTLQGMMVPA